MATRVREHALNAMGYSHVAGVDEVGVGPLAGPVVAAAVILPQDFAVEGVRDSKLVDQQERAELEREILACCRASGIGLATVEEIDTIGIYHASALAMRRAVEALTARPDFLLVDARRIELPLPQEGHVRGDREHTCIAAASIVAKEFRDRLMVELHRQFPDYHFAEHKGYPTKRHVQALGKHGPSPVHRISWLAVKEAAGLLSPQYYELERLIQALDSSARPALARRLSEARAQLEEAEYLRLRALFRRRLSRL